MLLLYVMMLIYKLTNSYMKLPNELLIINNFYKTIKKIYKNSFKTQKKELFTLMTQIKTMNKNFYLIILEQLNIQNLHFCHLDFCINF